MTTINDAYINALLADASYVDIAGSRPLEEQLSGRMTEPLAKFIGENFTVVTQVSKNGLLESSFDATVWKGNAGTPYAGQTYVSMRGTQEFTDFVQDVDLSLTGLAHAQLMDMVNWWLRETTPANLMAKQIAINTIVVPGGLTLQNFVAAPDVQGTGALADYVGAIKSINGHSLGGYLASAFVRLFGNQLPPIEIITFNSAGFNRLATFNIENGFNQITQVIGTGLGLSSFSGAQNNYFAENGINVTTNTWNPIGFRQYGERIGLFQENLTPSVYDNHSMYKLTDLLTLGNVMAQLDTTLDLTRLSALVNTASCQMANSYESVLDALRKLLLGPDVTPTKIGDSSAGNAGPQPDSRIEFQTNLKDLQVSTAFKAITEKVTIESLVGKSAAGIAGLAKDGDIDALAYRYALRAGNPFVVLTTPAFYAKHNTAGELDLYNATTGEGELTDHYLSDRAKYLEWRIRANTADKQELEGSQYGSYDSRNWEFTDLSIDSTFQTGNLQTIKVLGLPFDYAKPFNKMIFGGDKAEILQGGEKDDLLYGGGGNDTLDGSKGDDYIEGNAGKESLKGGEGNDILLGGIGDDEITGGTGNDILQGGKNNDTYIFASGDGTDIITDVDGSGSIKISGQTLGIATLTSESIYKDTASGQTIVKLNGGNTLVILKEGTTDRILVNDWSTAKALGLTLQDNTPTVPATTLSGDFKKATNGNDYVMLANGNYDSAGVEVNALDLISGTAGNDVIDGKGGDDALSGMAGDDFIVGGSGNDEIQGGSGKDTIIGGTGDDAIYGSSDLPIDKPTRIDFARPVNSYRYPQATGFNWTSGYYGTYPNGVPDSYSDAPRNRLAGDQGNIVDGGSGNDFIAAGTGADTVHGGVDNDLIYGMDKDDVLFGDGGNDLIYGDGNMPGGNSVVWTLPESHGNDVIDGGDGDDYIYGQGGNDIIFGGIGNDTIRGDDDEANLPAAYHRDDFLFGGAGADQLDGGGGNDYLEGGTGDDTIWGGVGKDIYIFNAGDGMDTVYDSKADNNIFRFGAGVNKDDIKLHLGSLMLDMGNGDGVHIAGFDQNDVFNSSSISSFEFADGSTLSTNELLARGFDIDGTADAEAILGTNTTDRITGKGGTDYLNGGAGDDTYIFQTGDSTPAAGGAFEDIIDESGNDTVRLNSVSASSVQVSAMNDGTVLLIEYGTSDKLAIVDGVGGAIENFEIGSEKLSTSQLIGHYSATTMTLVGDDGSQLIQGGRGNEWLVASGGNDTLSGGTGADLLYGGLGNDTYLWGAGDGQDFIDNTDTSTGSTDTLIITGGLLPADLVLGRIGNDLIVRLRNTEDRMTVLNHYSGTPIDAISFADGTLWNGADIDAHLNNELTANADIYYGTEGNDTINALDGNDTLNGAGGDDQLYGESGDDSIDGGAGNDTLDGGAGNDVLIGGAGNDCYVVDSSSDVVNEAANAGTDSVQSSVSYTLAANVENLTLTGTEAISGTGNALDNVLIGNGIANTLTGDAGNDTLIGGSGDDTLLGGAGNNTYRFARGDGQDTISSFNDATAGKLNVLEFMTGIAPGDIRLARANNDLTFSVSGDSDKVTVSDFFLNETSSNSYNPVQQVKFADSTMWTLSDLLARLSAPPSGSNNVVTINEDTPYTLRIADFGFSDPDAGDILNAVRIDRLPQAGSLMLNGVAVVAGQVITDPNISGLVFSPSYNANGLHYAGFDFSVEDQNGVFDTSPNTLNFNVTQVNDAPAFVGAPGTGIVTLDLTTSSYATGIAQQSDGKYVISAAEIYGGDFMVARFNKNGTPDTSFNGDGHVITSIGAGADKSQYVAIQADGRILVGGYSNPSTTSLLYQDFCLVRYNSDGSLDPTFSGDGIATTDIAGDNDASYAMAVQADGKIVLVGTTNAYNSASAIVRYRTDGSLDTSFDNDGKVKVAGYKTIVSVAIQSDGKILAAGYNNSNYDFLLQRYNANGSLDSTFNGSGSIIIDSGGSDYAYSTTIQSEGKILVIGRMGNTSAFFRFNIDGSRDTTFGVNGRVNTTHSDDLIAVQSDGKILVAGSLYPSSSILSLARYNRDGSLDTAFGSNGLVTTSVSGTSIQARSITVQTDGRILLAGYRGPSGTVPQNPMLIRYNADGSLDTSFGADPSIADRTIGQGNLLSFAIPSNMFIDLDAGDTLTYSATKADGSTLPSWLSFNPATRTFSGTPTSDDVGAVSVKVLVTDGGGLSTSSNAFNVTVTSNGNASPTGSVSISGTATQNQTLIASNTLSDADGMGSVGYQWQYSSDGSTWNAISGATAGSFTLAEALVGKQVRVLASYTDAHGTAESKASSATVTVANVNDTPTGTVTLTGTAAQNQALTAANTLADIDGLGSIGYQWQSSTDGTAWNAIAGATAGSFTLAEAQVGQQVRVVASYTDAHGTAESKASSATAAVANVNDTPIGGVTVTGTAAQNQILTADNTLADVDGLGTIAYQWQSSTDGTVWNAIAGATAGSFTLAEAQVGQQVRVVASYTDAHGTAESKASSATAAVANVNDVPTGSVTVAGTAAQNQTLTAANNLADIDGLGTIGYQWQSSTDGTTWTAISGATAGSFTLAEAQVGQQVRILASYTDAHGTAESKASSATAAIANVNDAPVVAHTIAAQSATEDTAFSFTVPGDAFTDVDLGDSLTFSATRGDGSALPDWLSFDAATRTFSGTPVNGDVGRLGLKVTATDLAGASASSGFDLAVANTNDDPVVANAILAQTASEATAFSFVVADNAFTDVDAGDVLSLSATQGDGSALPGWLSFDATARRFSGTPAFGDVGKLSLKVIATDLAGASVSQDVALTVSAVTGVNLIGSSGNDVLTGTPYNDTLDGAAGLDRMAGGAGNDTYYIDNTGDVVVELAGEGSDSVVSSITHSLAANVENLTLAGTVAINGTGNALNNVLTGNTAANILNGGAGADTLIGGLGNDTYVVDNVGDIVGENANEGTDLVQSSITWTLGDNVENLALTGTAAINGSGNALNNALTGNSAANTLSAGDGNDSVNGGAGADTLIGGLGNDTYVVDNVGDVISENAYEGADLVQSSVSYALSADVENLTLTGALVINGGGNALDNVLIGNSAANTLSGGDGNDTLNGGTGADTLIGGLGNDSYSVDNVGDVVAENANEGTDLLQSSVTCTLPADVENLTLIGTSAITGTGNTLDNVIIGNNAANTLSGGDGNDTLSGGTGSDALYGGAGDDTLLLAADNNWVSGYAAFNAGSPGNAGSGEFVGITGKVRLYDLFDGGSGVDSMQGTGGNDAIFLDDGFSPLPVAMGARFANVEIIRAGDGDDVIDLTSDRYGYGDVFLDGGNGNDVMWSSAGNDVLLAGAGNDNLFGGVGNDLHDGSLGNDKLLGAKGNDLLLGGLGNDILDGGAGNDVILFNKGDGQDTFATGGTGSDTLSLGGSFAYSDLTFTKSSADLVMKLGSSDQITFKNWYAATPSKPVVNLQVIAEAMAGFNAGGSDPLLDQKVEAFNFAGLAGAFDAARVANPTLSSWALTNALTSFQLMGSDTAALGGDLAYQYGKNGTLAGIGLTAAQGVINDASFGTQAQTLQALSSLQTGAVRLS